MKRSFSLVCAAALAAATVACGGIHTRSIKFSTTKFAEAQAISAADQARLDANCPDGEPKPLPDWPIGKTEMIFRDGYVLEHSSEWKVPYWVCESLDLPELGGTLPRQDDFRPDTTLTAGLRSELSDYKRSGFDRGHQAPAGDQTRDKTRKSETFFLSNMVPQNGNQNQRIWATLEDVVRGWAENSSIATNVRVITGPVFHDDADLQRGFSEIDTIGANNVGVPKALYKIVVGTVGGERRAVAFQIDNKSQGNGPFDFTRFIVTIQSIEEHTGFNFMPKLDPGDRLKLETQKGTLFK